MTLLEAEDVAKECRRQAPQGASAFLVLRQAAEAIEWLLAALNDAEGQIEYLEQFEP